MAILSTNQRLINIGQDYSAGENIGIYEHTISSRNWTPDITYAAESAFQRANEYTNTQISALSGEVSSEVSQLGSDIQYISGVALTSHQSLEGYLTKASGDEYYQPIGSYATVSQLESTSGEIVNLIPTDYVSNETLEQTSGNIVNLIPDTSEFITNASAEQTYQPIGNYATEQWVENKGYITEVSIPESATWQDVSTTVQTNSATWGQGGGTGGDAEVNSFVYNNSANILDVDTSYKTNSGLFLTAAPADMATTGDVAELAQTISETYQVKGDYLTTADSSNFYPANNPDGFITGVDLSNFYTKDETSGKEELSNAFANVPTPDYEVESYIHNNSASLNSTTDVVQSNSSVWSDITAYQSNSASYLTAHQSLDGYATETLVQDTSANITALIPDTSNFITNASAESTYQTKAGMTAYQSAGDYINGSNSTGFSLTSTAGILVAEENEYLQSWAVGIVKSNSGAWLSPNKIELYGGGLDETLNANDISSLKQLSSVKADTTALTAYQEITGMTAYQPIGDYATTADLALKQDTLTFGYDEQDRINSINSSALAGGTDIEFGYTDADTISSINTSAITDVGLNNIVQTNSGAWGGSALPISAGNGIKVNLVDNTLVFSNDETLLWEDNTDPAEGINGTKSINETVSNFENIDVYFWRCSDHSQTYRYYQINRVPVMSGSSNFATFWQESTAWFKMFLRISGTTATFREGHYTNAGLTDTLTETNMYSQGNIFKIVGINRIGG